MIFAGESEIVREDGIKLLESTQQEHPTDELPSSIKNIRPLSTD